MGSGCLSPQLSSGKVHISLVEQLYSTGPCSTWSPYIQPESSQIIRAKFSKNSSLRKLMDYLWSHRPAICQTLSHALKKSSQKGSLSGWSTGLLILDKIIDSFGQSKENRQTLKNISNQSSYQTQIKQKKILKNQNASRQDLISRRFQQLALGLISNSLQFSYVLAVEVLGKYANISAGLACEQKLAELLSTLLDNIRVNYSGYASLQAYCTVVLRIKQRSIKPVLNHLSYFFKRWQETKQIAISSVSLKQIQKIQQQTSWMQEIITKILQSAANSMAHAETAKILIQFYKQNNYLVPSDLQSMILQTILNADMGCNLIRMIVIQMLGEDINNNLYINYSKTIYNWLEKGLVIQQIAKYNCNLLIQTLFKIYKNYSSKPQVFQILNKITEKGLFNIIKCLFQDFDSRQLHERIVTKQIIIYIYNKGINFQKCQNIHLSIRYQGRATKQQLNQIYSYGINIYSLMPKILLSQNQESILVYLTQCLDLISQNLQSCNLICESITNNISYIVLNPNHFLSFASKLLKIQTHNSSINQLVTKITNYFEEHNIHLSQTKSQLRFDQIKTDRECDFQKINSIVRDQAFDEQRSIRQVLDILHN